MEFKFKQKIGEFEIEVSASSHCELFQKASFFTSLPRTGPSGETDLELRARKTKDGDYYYSIVSVKADQEFKLGISKQDEGNLFPKGWEPIYHADGNYSQESVAEETPEEVVEAKTVVKKVSPLKKPTTPKAATPKPSGLKKPGLTKPKLGTATKAKAVETNVTEVSTPDKSSIEATLNKYRK